MAGNAAAAAEEFINRLKPDAMGAEEKPEKRTDELT